MSLSACFLTRNEEAHIARAIRSVSGVADQIVVADTASTDRTAEVAAELGAEVSQFPWDDDFSAGRHHAIGRARGDWVLWLNADEEWLPTSDAALRDCMAAEDAFGYFVSIQNLDEPGRLDLFTETADLRLFRRRPDLQFVGRLHPGFTPAFLETIRREGLQVRRSDVAIRSHAYPSPPTESKLRWTARLLSRELQDRPGRLHYLIEYGRTLLMLDDPAGHAVMAEAAEQVLRARDDPRPPSWKVQSLLEYLLTVPPEDSRSRLGRREAQELALRWFPASPPLLWTIAQQCRRDRDDRRAAAILEQLLQLGRSSGYDRSRRFDPRIIGEQAMMDLGACYAKLGDYGRAEQCFSRLLDNPSCRDAAAHNLAIVRNRRPR